MPEPGHPEDLGVCVHACVPVTQCDCQWEMEDRHMHVYAKEMVGPPKQECISVSLVLYFRERVGDQLGGWIPMFHYVGRLRYEDN